MNVHRDCGEITVPLRFKMAVLFYPRIHSLLPGCTIAHLRRRQARPGQPRIPAPSSLLLLLRLGFVLVCVYATREVTAAQIRNTGGRIKMSISKTQNHGKLASLHFLQLPSHGDATSTAMP